MRKGILLCALAMMAVCGAHAQLAHNKYHEPIRVEKKWKKYNPGEVIFRDESPNSVGSDIYHRIIPNPVPYIQENARLFLQPGCHARKRMLT